MPRPEEPDAPGPEVPEEFAATYQEAYRRAFEQGEYDKLNTGIIPIVVDPVAAPADGTGDALQDTSAAVDGPGDRPAGGLADLRGSPWFLPTLIAALAVLLVLCAYVLGRALSGDGDDPGTAANAGSSASAEPTTKQSGKPSKKPSQRPSRSSSKAPTGEAYSGPADLVVPRQARATCVSRASIDSAGKKVRYRAGNTLDDDPATAWRCDGSATGESLRFRFDDEIDLVEVGLIPGYAKTDPISGADRYAENNRITKVRWTLEDGTSFEQAFDPDPADRGVQSMRIPKVSTDEITLEILAVADGPRNTTAISTATFAVAS